VPTAMASVWLVAVARRRVLTCASLCLHSATRNLDAATKERQRVSGDLDAATRSLAAANDTIAQLQRAQTELQLAVRESNAAITAERSAVESLKAAAQSSQQAHATVMQSIKVENAAEVNRLRDELQRTTTALEAKTADLAAAQVRRVCGLRFRRSGRGDTVNCVLVSFATTARGQRAEGAGGVGGGAEVDARCAHRDADCGAQGAGGQHRGAAD
jgi:hypothetical protein